jgi:ribonucleoside-triphosphate reductase (formate)
LGNQISYTLKYDPDVIDHKHFKDMLTEYQSRIRCCSVMPQTKGTSSYEYLPEQSMTKADYQEYMKKINNELAEEDVSFEHVDCAGGACPVDFK